MFGLSIYLSEDSVEKESYIQRMGNLGAKSIFTSLHIPEDDHNKYDEQLRHLGQLAYKYNMELFADISSKTLKYLGYTWDDVDKLKMYGLTGLRVDYGITEKLISRLSKKFKIALNASTITEESLQALKDNNLRIQSTEAWHNYYPRPETGIDLDDFNEKNEWLQSKGIKVMAFIPGDGMKRGPIFSGLPTLEKHRNISTFSSFIELMNNKWVDKIFIGDISVSDHSLNQFEAYKKGYILLRAVPYINDKEILDYCSEVQTNRFDAARDVIRSAESRQFGSIGQYLLDPFNTIERDIGAITVDNIHYGRYQGEVQICKRAIPKDSRVNVIGRIIKGDLPLLPYIKGGQKFKIEWTNAIR